MTALTFTLKSGLNHSVDCRALTPNLLADLSIAQINAIKLGSHNVVDLFTVTGIDAKNIVFNNSTSALEYIGFKMSRGCITINGDCGDFLGNQMQGGTIICKGNAGDRVGDGMRRGTVLVEGNVGEYCAATMKAGTIGVLGNTGARLGFGMKRGTLLLAKPPLPQATWLNCGLHSLPFLKLLFKSFASLDSQYSTLSNTRVQRYMGDVAGIGKAEILVLQAV